VQRLAPFGRANPAPALLLRQAQIVQPPGAVGREGKHLTLVVRQGPATTRCIAWNAGHRIGQLAEGMTLDLAARPKINAYRGRTSVELELLDMHLPATS
jgi:single-stranded-DNA-specific exonuclease